MENKNTVILRCTKTGQWLFLCPQCIWKEKWTEKGEEFRNSCKYETWSHMLASVTASCKISQLGCEYKKPKTLGHHDTDKAGGWRGWAQVHLSSGDGWGWVVCWALRQKNAAAETTQYLYMKRSFHFSKMTSLNLKVTCLFLYKTCVDLKFLIQHRGQIQDVTLQEERKQ